MIRGTDDIAGPSQDGPIQRIPRHRDRPNPHGLGHVQMPAVDLQPRDPAIGRGVIRDAGQRSRVGHMHSIRIEQRAPRIPGREDVQNPQPFEAAGVQHQLPLPSAPFAGRSAHLCGRQSHRLSQHPRGLPAQRLPAPAVRLLVVGVDGRVHFTGVQSDMPRQELERPGYGLFLEVAAPGMKKDDFRLNLENNVLTICSERKDEKEEKKENYSRKEFSYQSFQRRFTLPEGHIKQDKISAKYVDGILTIELPKREEVKPQPPKEISIS